MYKFNSVLKVLALTFLFGFFVACSDDDDDSNPINPNGNTDPTGKIEASELVVIGKLEEMNIYDYGTFSAWSLGARDINVYLGVNGSADLKIGEGTVDANGNFEYTLQKSMLNSEMVGVGILDEGLEYSPSDLSKSLVYARPYIVLDEGERVMFTEIVDADNTQNKVEYFYAFYSHDGSVTGDSEKFDGSFLRHYEVSCSKGWNLEEHSLNPATTKTISALPSEAKNYILNSK